MKGSTGFVAQDAHLAACLECTQPSVGDKRYHFCSNHLLAGKDIRYILKTMAKEMTVKELAAMGGRARAEALTKKRRKEIATDAAKKRWANQPANTAIKKNKD